MPSIPIAPDDLRRASAFFPLVGLGVAGVGIAIRAAAEPVWGAGAATIAAIAAMIAVTGALHEDGLADTADGLWGGWDPAARLAIMRDSSIGTYGTIALIIALGLRAGWLLPLSLADFARAVACGHVLGRASTLVLARLLPPADRHAGSPAGAPAADGPASTPLQPMASIESPASPPEDAPLAAGAGAEEPTPVRRPRLGAAVIGPIGPAAALTAAVVVAATIVVAAGAFAAVPLVVGLAVSLACASLFRRRLGGLTGDTLGATTQLVDLAVIATIAALARAGLL
jgi:adenosylcobinamide-GDP ribazoletransferase